ncbi:MAG: tetratricopeptide repeat protein [Verrucomicrobia bacterium]|nr:tetratricopeptide repeat protein [Verrucomicrobiota bacterium]
MRYGVFGQFLVAILLGMAAGGCRSVPPPVIENPESASLSPLSDGGAARAESLAFYAQGLRDERRRDYESALTNFQSAARRAPGNEELSLRVALLLLQQRRVDEAVQVMEAAYSRRPRSEKTLRWTALVNRAADRMDRVEALYRELIKLDPTDPDAYLELTALLVQGGKNQEAIRLLETGLDRVTEPLDLLRLLAGLHAEQAAAVSNTVEATAAREKAIEALERARALAPEDASLLFQLGDLYLADQQIEKAIEFFEAVEQNSPDSLAIRQKLALSFLKLGDSDKTIEALENLSRLTPGHPRLFFYLGELYREKGDLEKALLNFSLAEKAFPDDPTPLLRKALILTEDLKQPEAAATALLEGLKNRPDNVHLLEMLAYVYYDMKDYPKALEYFQRRHDRAKKDGEEPVSPLFYFNFALASEAAGRPDDAAQHLHRALNQNPAYLEAYLHHAFLQTEEEPIRLSIRVLEKVGRLQSDEPNVYYYLALLNSYLKSYPAALDAFEKAERLVDDSPFKNGLLDAKFFFWYGAAAERNGEFERAEKLLGRCLELDPNHMEAYNYLAYMWAEQGVQLDRALEYVQKALAANPSSAAFIDTLGWIYYMGGSYPQALEQLHKAADLMPDDPTILDHLGDALFKLGDETQALPHWKRSFVLDPENKAVEKKLRRFNVNLAPLRKEAKALKKEREALEPQEDPDASPEEAEPAGSEDPPPAVQKIPKT